MELLNAASRWLILSTRFAIYKTIDRVRGIQVVSKPSIISQPISSMSAVGDRVETWSLGDNDCVNGCTKIVNYTPK